MKRTIVLLAVFVLLGSLLLASLWLAGDTSLVRADEPEQPLIPRHRVGHRSKVQNLDVLLEQGGDPLAGNYRLVADDEILVTGQHNDQTTMVQTAFDVDQTLNALSLLDQAFDGGDLTAVATGNFNGDSLADYVVLRSINEALYMDVGYLKDGTNVAYSFDTGQKVHSGYPPSVATGDFDGDGQDEIVMAWLGGGEWANLQVYDPQGSIHPAAKSKLYDEQVANGNLDVAAGDFDGDGNDEVVLAWEDLGNWVAAKLYDVDQSGVLSAKAKVHLSGGGVTLAVSTGDLNGDALDEIAIADGYYLRLLQPTKDLGSLASKGKGGMGECYTEDHSYIPSKLAVGDLNADAMDDLVTSCHWSGGIDLIVWSSDSNLGLHQHADWTKSGDYAPSGSLAVGDLNKDLRGEIVIASTVVEQPENQGDPTIWHNYLQVLQISTDLKTITPKGSQDLGQVQEGGHLAVAVGDLDGDSIRVGQPTYSMSPQAKQLLATINEPPKHYDKFDSTVTNVNSNTLTYASYENKISQSTSMSLTTTRDWGVSTELEAEAYGINASLQTSYGENFENTTSSFKEQTFGQTAWAQSDDLIMRTETDFDVWEYPVYSDTANTVQGYLVVVFPRKRDPNCTSNCETSVIARIDGKNPLSYYTPNHENHDVLSYSSDPPDDIGTSIKSSSRNYVGSDPYEFWVDWTDVENQESKQSKKLDVAVGVGVEGWGIKANVKGTYSQGQVSTQKVSFETDTSVHVYFHGIDLKYAYSVDPYLYWSSTDNHLVLDYATRPETASPPTWWQNTYAQQPDPAMNLPWKYNPPTEAYRLLTKEITFDPYSPTAGEQVTITARVRNYSLLGAGQVKVQFYRGDPAHGGAKIGAEQTTATLNPMSSRTVQVYFDTSGFGGQTLDIYAVVDPDNAIQEVHDETSPPDNNTAYAQLPVKPAGVAAARPINLAISDKDISVRPEAPVAGETVHISATVEAEGDAFTYVGVEFWDGDPRQGGQFIGGELIPMILAGETATAHIAWGTAGKLGTHDIWVGVDHLAVDEDLYTDNRAQTAIHLEPYRQYLPLAYKDS